MRGGTLAVVLAGVGLWVGCLLIWVFSPGLTAGYNSDYTGEFFLRVPAGLAVVGTVLGWLGPLGETPQTARDIVARLELGLLVMCVGYVLGLLALRRTAAEGNGKDVWVVLGFAAVFRLTMASLPGLFSTDIFSYVMYGRIAAVYQQNPYVQVPNDFPADPFLAWVFPFWRDQPSVYGPVWTDFSWLLSRLTANASNFDQVMTYRLTLIGLELFTLGLVWWLLGQPAHHTGSGEARALALATYAWNPLVLFDLVGSTHNDVAMLALLLLGLAIKNGSAIGPITLSALTKFATGVVAPIWSVAYAANGSRSTRKLERLVASGAVAVVLAVILWWPWLQTPAAFTPLGEAAGGRLVINSAPDLVALFVADQILVPGGTEQQLAKADARFWVRTLTKLVYAAYLLWEITRLWSAPAVKATLAAATRALLLLPLLVLTWVWSWYFSWPLVLAVLLGWQSRLTRLVVTYTLVALPVVYAHQYLNEDFSGGFVLLMALGPLLVLAARDYSGSQRPTAQPQPVPAGER